MLVLAGRPVELDAHMERLSQSLEALYGRGLPTRTADTAVEKAAGVRHGRLRVTVLRGGDGWLRTRIESAPVNPVDIFPTAARSATLHSVVVEGGLGAHKWADRRLLEQASAKLAPRSLPLLTEDDGTVLEVSRASVFLVRGDEIVTPPLDGRILPGIARRRVLEIACAEEGIAASEEPLTMAGLADGEEVFIAGSLRGVEPVRSIDGAELPANGEISRRIAARLRDRWLQTPRVEPAAAVAGARPADRPAR